nr:hypothetical protein [Nocardia sp. SYP-A9097]
MAVFLAEVSDVAATGFADPQPEETEHRDQGEVGGVVRVAGGAQQCLELQMRKS